MATVRKPQSATLTALQGLQRTAGVPATATVGPPPIAAQRKPTAPAAAPAAAPTPAAPAMPVVPAAAPTAAAPPAAGAPATNVRVGASPRAASRAAVRQLAVSGPQRQGVPISPSIQSNYDPTNSKSFEEQYNDFLAAQPAAVAPGTYATKPLWMRQREQDLREGLAFTPEERAAWSQGQATVPLTYQQRLARLPSAAQYQYNVRASQPGGYAVRPTSIPVPTQPATMEEDDI